MPIKAAAVTVAPSFRCGGGATILCSHIQLLSLTRPSSKPHSNSSIRGLPLFTQPYHKIQRYVFISRAADSTQPTSAAAAAVDKPTVSDDEFTLAKYPAMVMSLQKMTRDFVKLERFEGGNFRHREKKMHFLLTTLKVVYVLTISSPEEKEDENVEQTRERIKWENDYCIYQGHILNAFVGCPVQCLPEFRNGEGTLGCTTC